MHGTGATQNYSTSAKLLHWGFIGFFAYGIFKQVDDLSQLEDPSFLRFEFIFACVFSGTFSAAVVDHARAGARFAGRGARLESNGSKACAFWHVCGVDGYWRQWAGRRCRLHAWHAQWSAHGVLYRGT